MKNTSHFATVVNVKDRRLSPEDREEFRKIHSLQGGIFSGKNRAQRQRMTSGFASMRESRTLPNGF